MLDEAEKIRDLAQKITQVFPEGTSVGVCIKAHLLSLVSFVKYTIDEPIEFRKEGLVDDLMTMFDVIENTDLPKIH